MAQIGDGSGGGDSLDSGSTDSLDDSGDLDADNLDGADTQPPERDDADRTPPRRLRDDAVSDPMSEQTEQPQVSPEDTSATAASGSEDAGATSNTDSTQTQTQETSQPSPEGTSATVGGGDGATTPTEQDAQRFDDELGGDPAGTTGERGATPSDAPTPAQQDGVDVSSPDEGAQPVSGTGPSQDGQQTPPEATDVTGGAVDNTTTATPTTGTPGQEGVAPPEAGDVGQTSNTRQRTQTEIVELPSGREVVRSTETGRVLGEPDDVQQQFESQVEAQIEEQTGRDVTPGEEFTVVERGGQFVVQLSGSFSAALSREAARDAGIDLGQQAERAENRAQIEGQGPAVESGGFGVATGYFDPTAGEAIPGRGSVNVEAVEDLGERRERAEQDRAAAEARASGAMSASSALGTQAQQEQFGDIDWSFGLGGPGDEVERSLRDASETYQEFGQTFASNLFAEDSVAGQSLGEEVLRAAGRPDLGRDYERGLRQFGEGVAQSAFMITDLPGLAGTALEGAEYGVYATQQAAPKTGAETGERLIDIGEALEQEVRENPASFAGLGIGSLAASYGIMSAAARVSPRAGVAARYAIQPGEELAGSLGYRATRRAASTRTAERLFPNREPLIFSEEAALRTARGLYKRAPDARAKATDLVLGEPETTRQVVRSRGRVDRFEETTQRPGFVEQARRGASRVEDAFTGRTYAGIPIPRTEVETETRARPSTEAETEVLLDELEGPLRRMEESRARRRGKRREAMRGRGPPSEFRGPTVEYEIRTELESAEPEAVTRTQLAQLPFTETGIGNDILGDVQSRSDVAQEPLVETRGRQDTLIDTEVDSRQDLEIFQEFEFESENELEFAFEFESETEQETELEFEAEQESRQEVEPFGIQPRNRDSEDTAADFTGRSRLVKRDLLNPFTGE